MTKGKQGPAAHRRFPLPLRAAVAVAALLACFAPGGAVRSAEGGGFAGAGDEALVPAALGVRTDLAGNSWNIEANGTIGRIGGSMVNSGMTLFVNDEKFVGYQPMMTPDGKEFVLRGLPFDGLPGLQVLRRIKLMEEIGGLRYAEMLYNGSADPVSLSLSLTTNFSGNFRTYLTDRGRTEPVMLSPGESGVVVLPGSSQAAKAYLMSLAEPGAAAMRPSISAQNRYGLTVRYPVEIAPGGFAVVVHHVAQVVIPRNYDRRSLFALFRPFSFAETARHLSPDWADFAVNLETATVNPALRGYEEGGLARLGIPPGARDTLAAGEGTRLQGSVAGESVVLRTGRGDEAEIPLAEIAALEGKGGRAGRTPRVHLRDGQIFKGEIEAGGLRFVQAGGGEIELDAETLDRLVMAAPEGAAGPPEAGSVLVETYRGERFKIKDAGSVVLTGTTAWGDLPVALDELAWLGPAPGEFGGHRVEMADGTRCLVYFTNGLPTFDTGYFLVESLNTNIVKHIFTPFMEEVGRGLLPGEGEAALRLGGNQEIPGSLARETLPVVSDGQVLEIPVADIRSLERVPVAGPASQEPADDASLFRLEQWNGGVVEGALRTGSLALSVRGGNWEVPLRDVERAAMPAPAPDPAVVAEIRGLVELLGSEQWAERERATRELGAFGHLARHLLEGELRGSTDPEVARRLERILSELE